MFKKYAESAVMSLDTAHEEWDAQHRDRAVEWYMIARTEALVSIALSLAKLAENGNELDAARLNG